ncbi:hypothetical protein B0H14DRAFT_3520278 [Mycena olivaceomarginata]|nr:hypothetical protein B0H14DRAFT_3520278 [Mycena olivaceomarginata]
MVSQKGNRLVTSSFFTSSTSKPPNSWDSGSHTSALESASATNATLYTDALFLFQDAFLGAGRDALAPERQKNAPRFASFTNALFDVGSLLAEAVGHEGDAQEDREDHDYRDDIDHDPRPAERSLPHIPSHPSGPPHAAQLPH